ncbi:MAG: hypothetical protein ABL958_16185 [Bdellovibrionia bacterium]
MKWNLTILIGALAIGITACSGQFEFEQQSTGGLEKAEGEEGSEAEIACDPAAEECVLLCHVPPGNPAARHNILVGEPAVVAHLTNHDRGETSHDYLGECLDDETQGELDALFAPAVVD